MKLTSFGWLVVMIIDKLIIATDGSVFCFVGFACFPFLKRVHGLFGIGVDLSYVFVSNELYEVFD